MFSWSNVCICSQRTCPYAEVPLPNLQSQIPNLNAHTMRLSSCRRPGIECPYFKKLLYKIYLLVELYCAGWQFFKQKLAAFMPANGNRSLVILFLQLQCISNIFFAIVPDCAICFHMYHLVDVLPTTCKSVQTHWLAQCMLITVSMSWCAQCLANLSVWHVCLHS